MASLRGQARILGPFRLELNRQGLGGTSQEDQSLVACGQADEESFDAEGASVSCPWFYPVVEQHDVTYHRVKPLAGHRETDTHGVGATPPSRAWREGHHGHHRKRAIDPQGPTQRAAPPANRGPEISEPNTKRDVPTP